MFEGFFLEEVMKRKFSWTVFWLAMTAMFLCGLFVLGLMVIAKAYSMIPGSPWPGAAFLPFIALAYGAVEAFDATRYGLGEDDCRNEELQLRIDRGYLFLLWGNPLGWLFLLAIWLLKKSPSVCFFTGIIAMMLPEKD